MSGYLWNKMNIRRLLDSHLFACVTSAFLHNALRNTTNVHKDLTHESTPHTINPRLFNTSAGILKYALTNRYNSHIKGTQIITWSVYTLPVLQRSPTQNPMICALLVSWILAICPAHSPVLTVRTLGPKLYWVYHDGSAILQKNVPSVKLHL